ncbi:MAG: MarR family transcriptional regulator [Chloroflexota bacterium]|nr:MarR family transcriptional regulator [Chloroflexota bacterium]
MDAEENPVTRRLLEAFTQFRRTNARPGTVAGVTHSELMVLACIKEAMGSNENGIRVSEISSLLRVAMPTITQQLNSLTTGGYVEKRSDPDDGRVVRIILTPRGESVMQAARDVLVGALAGLVDYLGEEKTNMLIELMGEVSTYFQDVRAGTP